MPVRKFRSVEEQPPPADLPPLTPETVRLAFEHMELSQRLCPIRFTPGVRKFRSMEEANRAREEDEARAIREAKASAR